MELRLDHLVATEKTVPDAEANTETKAGSPIWRIARKCGVPFIGVVAAIAMYCVVVDVFDWAKVADDVALDTQRQLFTRALTSHAERVLRETQAVAASETAYRKVRADFDLDWIKVYVSQRLQSYFDHDFVAVADPANRLIYASFGNRGGNQNWVDAVRSQLNTVLDQARSGAGGAASDDKSAPVPGSERSPGSYVALRLQNVLDRPAIIAGVAITSPDDTLDDVRANAPVIVSIKFIDDAALAEAASHLQLTNLRVIDGITAPLGDHTYELMDSRGKTIAQFAWTPARAGTEVARNTIPFVLIGIAVLAFLALTVLNQLRRKRAKTTGGESRLRHLAMHDALCDLPNRAHFSERLENQIKKARDGGPPAAVFYIDLDHFKDVNDTLGHPIGDELIRIVALRLRNALAGQDLVARIGGDEFAVIIISNCNHAVLQKTAERLIGVLSKPYSISNHPVVIGASIGISVIGADVVGSADVLRHADMALYRAKNEGRNRACLYDSKMDKDILMRKQIEGDLRSAIENNRLEVEYQPIVSNGSEKVIGVEALCRWTHPIRGVISPGEFIPIAENSGLIIGLGEWVLRRACLDAKSWPGIFVSVNVSPMQFRRPDFVDKVQRVISETDLDPTRLELEITETTLIGNTDAAELAMVRLKALGVQLVLDDFGTGYSSLLHLRRYPFDKLKVDRSFIIAIERAADTAAIVNAIVTLGRGLGIKVTAEGVETAGQRLFLRAAGVHSMQGYHIGRPCPAEYIAAKLGSPPPPQVSHDRTDLAQAS